MIEQESRTMLFEAQKQAVIDHNESVPNILEPAPQDILTIISPTLESALKTANDLYRA